MKILRILLLVILVIIAVPLIMALFVKDDYTVQRDVVINKPKQEVFNYIRLLKNQSHYSKWVMMDPNAQMTYTGTDGTEGFVSAWDSKNEKVGQGSQTITKITDGQKIDLAIHFIKPFDGNASAYLATDSVAASQTKVSWVFYGKLQYPMKVMHVFMNMDKMIGGDLTVGLANLKQVLEK